MADNDNDIPAIPLPPAAGGVPPVEPPPATPPAPPAAPVPPAPPAAAGAPAAPQPLPPVAAPQADPYAAPGATPNPYAQPQAGYIAPTAYAPVAAGPAQGLSLAALITGIAAVLLSFVGFGFLPAVAAVILGHFGQRRQPYARPLWLTGLITGYVALGISLITGLVAVAAIIIGFASDSY